MAHATIKQTSASTSFQNWSIGDRGEAEECELSSFLALLFSVVDESVALPCCCCCCWSACNGIDPACKVD